MNCREFHRALALDPDGGLPPDARGHIEACASCRTLWEHQRAVQKLLSLKRHEIPAPGAGERCVAGVLRRLRNPGGQAGEEGMPWMGWLGWYPAPAFRYALAAGLAILLVAGGILFFALRPRPAVQQAGQPHPPFPVRELVDSSTNLTTNLELPANRMVPLVAPDSTNIDPARIEYGTQPSRVVDYRY